MPVTTLPTLPYSKLILERLIQYFSATVDIEDLNSSNCVVERL